MNKKNTLILLAHGDGGKKSSDLVHELILKHLGNKILSKLEDSAVLENPGKKIAFTTDSFVVKPVFFPGGDIGKLCVCGTINDLVTSGCKPAALSLSLIIEEGFPYNDLVKIILSIKKTLYLTGCDIGIVTGDTKVVEKGSADRIYINTSGIGYIDNETNISPANIKEGDDIIINGSIGEHGVAILGQRPEFNFKTGIISDCAPLDGLVSEILKISRNVHSLRDATRGGLARVLIEMSGSCGLDFEIYEENIPLKKEVRGICEFLGMDPLYIANEGKMVFFSDPGDSNKILETMRKNKYGKDAALIGKVKKNTTGKKIDSNPGVILITKYKTKRLLDIHYSEQLPRIC
jgi:hydrogenase expression/formation protein HypE